ncbi:hypothetical protein KAR91_84115 [Candidatus Pacearchaeota archaeon]|nr:hypothetical protein [Candidatus Pacearchaeota archaeon]
MVDIYYTGNRKQRQRLRDEFENLLDPRLRAIILESAHFLNWAYGQPTFITCIDRSPAENEAVGGKPYSGHLDNRAVDTRSRHLTEQQKKGLIIKFGPQYSKEFLQLLHHDSGRGEHFHWGIRYAYKGKPVP